MKRLVLGAAILASLASAGFAKDLSDKIGVGFNSQLGNGQALSARYWLSDNTGVEGIFGFQLGDNKVFDIGGKFLRVLQAKQNMNVYGFGIIGLESYDYGNNVDGTIFTLGGGLGTEFFLQGLPDLGFGLEIGVGFSGQDDNNNFGTFSAWLTNVGARYYF